jgi:hypothetical protein
MRIKAGTYINFEQGQWSDFSYEGPFCVIKGFDQKQIAEEYRTKEENHSVSGFISYLYKNNYVTDAPSHRWWLGDFLDFAPEIDAEPE